MMIPILILAAGASKRMQGRDKLLMDIGDGMPLLRHTTAQAVATGHPVFVTLPIGNTARRHVLADYPVTIIDVAEPEFGMGASLTTGLGHICSTVDGVVISLADMPDITRADYMCLINAFKDDSDANIHRVSTEDGTPGNPVLLPQWACRELPFYAADYGARAFIKYHSDKLRLVRIAGKNAITDLDTPEDWAAWRMQNNA